MASSVSAELLKQLSVASEALNNVSDIFNEQIKIIEEAIASYNIGVSAWATAGLLEEEEYAPNGELMGVIARDISVGYDRQGGKWCLLASSLCPEREGRIEWTLRDAPRDVRMEAINSIPKLLERLIEEAQKLTADVTKKTSEARMLAASIKPRKAL